MTVDGERAGGPMFEFVGRPSRPGVTWAWARADLDLATVGAARTELTTFLLAGTDELGCVLVHLGAERFVDLQGMRLLLDTATRVRSRGGELIVVAPPRCLHLVVRMAGAAAELPLVETPGRALRRARAHRPRSLSCVGSATGGGAR